MEEKDLSEMRVPRIWNDLYIEMLANPMDDTTDKDFCAEIGISVNALMKWKKAYRKSIYAEVQKRRNQHINELRAAAYKALGRKMDKDTNALKLALQVTGDLVERSESKVEMTESEKLRRIETLRTGVENRTKAWRQAHPVSEDGSGSGSGLSTPELGGDGQGSVN